MDEVDERAIAVQPISKGGFFALVTLTCTMLVPLESIAIWCGCRMVGVRFPIQGCPGGLSYLNFIASILIVDAILRRMGRSLSGTTREIRTRVVGFQAGETDDGDVVEVHIPGSVQNFAIFGGLGGCLAGGGVALFATAGSWQLGGLSFAAVMAVLSVYLIHGALSGGAQARADAAGITGFPIGFHNRQRFVPWSDVLTCEIRTMYDTFGKPILTTPILKGTDDRVLLALNLQLIPMSEQERLIKYIGTRLPKTKDDWDWS